MPKIVFLDVFEHLSHFRKNLKIPTKTPLAGRPTQNGKNFKFTKIPKYA